MHRKYINQKDLAVLLLFSRVVKGPSRATQTNQSNVLSGNGARAALTFRFFSGPIPDTAIFDKAALIARDDRIARLVSKWYIFAQTRQDLAKVSSDISQLDSRFVCRGSNDASVNTRRCSMRSRRSNHLARTLCAHSRSHWQAGERGHVQLGPHQPAHFSCFTSPADDHHQHHRVQRGQCAHTWRLCRQQTRRPCRLSAAFCCTRQSHWRM